jgi:hypothetical protein
MESTKKDKDTKPKTSRNQKDKSQRVIEIVKAFKKMRELGFPDDNPAIVEFKQITNRFIEDGVAVTGKIPMPEYDRMLCYILTNHSLKESTIALKSTIQ